jgi:hypothetical protein
MRNTALRDTSKKLGTVATVLLVATSLTTTGLGATRAQADAMVYNAGFIAEVGGAERINHSGRLRLLSQEIASASCYFNAGIDTEARGKRVMDDLVEFERILAALEVGDESLGIIGPEQSRKVLTALEAVKAAWGPYKSAAAGLVDGTAADAGMQFLSQNNMALLDAAQILVTEVSTQYSNPAEMVQADALILDIAGRQRMLTRRISKGACATHTGNAELGGLESLQKDMKLYETSLLALRDGNESVGIMPPPTPEIKAALDVIFAEWEVSRKGLETVTGANAVDPEALLTTLKTLDGVVGQYNDVLKLYVAASKTGL